MAIIHDGNSVPISTTNPLPSSLYGSEIQVPVDIQSRYAMTIQTHAAVMLPPTTGSSSSVWIDTNGFDKVGLTFVNDGSTNAYTDVQWSNDGTTLHGDEIAFISSGDRWRSIVIDTKARYMKVVLNNTDAAPHTMSAWAYLKV